MKTIYLFIISILIFSCNKHDDIGPVHPYTITISNISKKDRKISLKIYQKIDNTIKIPPFELLAPRQDNGEYPIKANEEFFLTFNPYENNEKNIGKTLSFFYEIYENNNLIIKKEIRIKSDYSNTKEKNTWDLKAEIFEINDNTFVTKISNVDPLLVKLEF